jgi:predicted dehydrogenase
MAAHEVGVGVIDTKLAVFIRVHSHAWLNTPLFYGPTPAVHKLRALFGRNSRKVADAVKAFGFSKTYSKWRDLVKDPAVEIVDSCAPLNPHAEP